MGTSVNGQIGQQQTEKWKNTFFWNCNEFFVMFYCSFSQKSISFHLIWDRSEFGLLIPAVVIRCKVLCWYSRMRKQCRLCTLAANWNTNLLGLCTDHGGQKASGKTVTGPRYIDYIRNWLNSVESWLHSRRLRRRFDICPCIIKIPRFARISANHQNAIRTQSDQNAIDGDSCGGRINLCQEIGIVPKPLIDIHVGALEQSRCMAVFGNGIQFMDIGWNKFNLANQTDRQRKWFVSLSHVGRLKECWKKEKIFMLQIISQPTNDKQCELIDQTIRTYIFRVRNGTYIKCVRSFSAMFMFSHTTNEHIRMITFAARMCVSPLQEHTYARLIRAASCRCVSINGNGWAYANECGCACVYRWLLNNTPSIQCESSFDCSKMGVHNKNLRTAVSLTVVAFILIFLAFVSPYWLVFDGQLRHPKFLNLGKLMCERFLWWHSSPAIA